MHTTFSLLSIQLVSSIFVILAGYRSFLSVRVPLSMLSLCHLSPRSTAFKYLAITWTLMSYIIEELSSVILLVV